MYHRQDQEKEHHRPPKSPASRPAYFPKVTALDVQPIDGFFLFLSCSDLGPRTIHYVGLGDWFLSCHITLQSYSLPESSISSCLSMAVV